MVELRSLEELKATMEDRLRDHRDVLSIFSRAFFNTLETTTKSLSDGSTYVFTGDIPAMWLRDSSAQLHPYIRSASHLEDVAQVIKGLIQKQAEYLLIDPYANAFNETANGHGHTTDITTQSPWVWERKFEIDSLCYPIRLCAEYIEATGDSSVLNDTVHRAFRVIVNVMKTEQHHDRDSMYRFVRMDGPKSDTLPFGTGTRTNFTGMVWSGFRPSDDACKFGYHIPGNMFASVVLRYMERMCNDYYHDTDLGAQARELSEEIDFGISTYGITHHPKYGRIYAYETDGFGNYNLMDDANVPSLLSIPYIGYRGVDHPIYQNTRRFVLSEDNPYFYRGAFAEGVGSPHTPKGNIWPIGLIMQGMTTRDKEEQDGILASLLRTTGGTGLMHESFDPNDPSKFTRDWFAWANSLFGEFVLQWIAGK